MDEIIQQSVNKLIDELQKRIELLTSSTTRANLDENSYNTINEIISKNIHTSPSRLTAEDIIDFKINDIELILDTIGIETSQKNSIMTSFNPNVYSIRNTSNKTRALEIGKFFEEIRKMIMNYLNDFEDINSNQLELQTKKVTEYSYYIELFKKDKFDVLFEEEDMDKLLKLMSTIAMPVADRQHILQYVALQNLNVPNLENNKYNEEYMNISSKVNKYIELYLEDDSKEKDIVGHELSNRDIDIDLLPSIAVDISENHSLNYEKVKNILIAMVLNSLFSEYTKAIDNEESEEYINSFRNKIKDTLAIDASPENAIILEAQNIISNNEELYKKNIELEENVSKYISMLISEIESEGHTHEEAVDLKSLPIIKSITETLDKISRTEKDTEDYNLCCGMLIELVQAYNNLIEKKNKNTLKIN